MYPGVYRELWLQTLTPLFNYLPKNKHIFDPENGKPQDHYIFFGSSLLIPGYGIPEGSDPGIVVWEGFYLDYRFKLNILRLLNVKYLLSDLSLNSEDINIIHSPLLASVSVRSRDWATGLYNDIRKRKYKNKHIYNVITQPFVDYIESIEHRRSGKDIFIYELLETVPRFRFVEEVVIKSNSDQGLNLLEDSTIDTLKKVAVMESNNLHFTEDSVSHSMGKVWLKNYSNDKSELTIENLGKGFLVIVNSWNPYWKAYINGNEQKLHRVNHAQYGMITKAGRYTIKLVYSPPYTFKGLLNLWNKII